MKPYCTQNEGHCETCSLVNYGLDCKNFPLNDKAIDDLIQKNFHDDLFENLSGYKEWIEENKGSEL